MLIFSSSIIASSLCSSSAKILTPRANEPPSGESLSFFSHNYYVVSKRKPSITLWLSALKAMKDRSNLSHMLRYETITLTYQKTPVKWWNFLNSKTQQWAAESEDGKSTFSFVTTFHINKHYLSCFQLVINNFPQQCETLIPHGTF